MTYYGYACIDNALYGINYLNTALKFNSITTRLFHHANGITNSFNSVHLIRTERHIAHNEGTLSGTSH